VHGAGSPSLQRTDRTPVTLLLRAVLGSNEGSLWRRKRYGRGACGYGGGLAIVWIVHRQDFKPVRGSDYFELFSVTQHYSIYQLNIILCINPT
jgi:hypothetical protein